MGLAKTIREAEDREGWRKMTAKSSLWRPNGHPDCGIRKT